MTFDIGDKFKLSNAALENYGEDYRDKVYTVRSWANKYVPSAEYFKNPTLYPHGHPGNDEGSGGRLYEADGLNMAVYDWEMRKA